MTQLKRKVWILIRRGRRRRRRVHSVRVEGNPSKYEYKTYSCLQVPNLSGAGVEILLLTVRHEKDLPCRWIRGQVVEIDRERD